MFSKKIRANSIINLCVGMLVGILMLYVGYLLKWGGIAEFILALCLTAACLSLLLYRMKQAIEFMPCDGVVLESVAVENDDVEKVASDLRQKYPDKGVHVFWNKTTVIALAD